MRKVVEFLLVGCLLAVPATAQRGRGGMSGFHGGGFGGPGFHGGYVNRGFQGYRGGYYRGGYYRGGYYGGYYRGGYYRNRFFYGYGVPYWPYYGAGWYYSPYAYPYYAYSYPYSYPYSYSYSSDYGNAYGNPDRASCPQANGAPLYLIKLTYEDRVWIAQNYWYTAGTLNFTTLQGEQNKTPIDTIDRAFTFQLNSACGVTFQLPGH